MSSTPKKSNSSICQLTFVLEYNASNSSRAVNICGDRREWTVKICETKEEKDTSSLKCLCEHYMLARESAKQNGPEKSSVNTTQKVEHGITASTQTQLTTGNSNCYQISGQHKPTQERSKHVENA